MEKEELVLKTKQKLDEIQEKINDIKEKVEQNTNDAIHEKSEHIINELKELGEKIHKQYSKLGLPENQSKPNITEMEKNIFNSIRSFDSAFQRAGSIFKPH
ncbi:MAG TPA: hypothetical protein DCG75_17755 [Bacteroidales bacterium]|nr:hypothetical protein [Bacteroidales bacterium]